MRCTAISTHTPHTQEPWPEAEIKEFVSKRFGTQFDLFAKVNVNGADAHPLFQWLKSRLSGTFGECAPLFPPAHSHAHVHAHLFTCSLAQPLSHERRCALLRQQLNNSLNRISLSHLH